MTAKADRIYQDTKRAIEREGGRLSKMVYKNTERMTYNVVAACRARLVYDLKIVAFDYNLQIISTEECQQRINVLSWLCETIDNQKAILDEYKSI